MPSKPKIPDCELTPEELAKRIKKREADRRYRQSRDPEKHRAYQRQWRDQNADKVRALNRERNRRWRAKNPDKVREVLQRYREANFERIKESQQRSREKHREKRREKNRERMRSRRKVNPAKWREHDRRWREAHREAKCQSGRIYYEKNKVQIAVRIRRWREQNPARVIGYRWKSRRRQDSIRLMQIASKLIERFQQRENSDEHRDRPSE